MHTLINEAALAATACQSNPTSEHAVQVLIDAADVLHESGVAIGSKGNTAMLHFHRSKLDSKQGQKVLTMYLAWLSDQ